MTFAFRIFRDKRDGDRWAGFAGFTKVISFDNGEAAERWLARMKSARAGNISRVQGEIAAGYTQKNDAR